jgi:RHS repeat-associated protein
MLSRSGLKASRHRLNGCKRLLVAALLASLCASSAGAQTGTASGQTPPGIAPGTPAGSYGLSGFDRVNLYSGNLNFSLPLLKVGGRGGAVTSVNLTINSVKWRIEREAYATQTLSSPPNLRAGESAGPGGDSDFDPADYTPAIAWFASDDCWLLPYVYCFGGEADRPNSSAPPQPDLNPILDLGGGGGYYLSYPTPEWWGDLRVGYGPGVMMGRWQGMSGNIRSTSNKTLTRLTFIGNDGTEHELRDVLTDGKPVIHPSTEAVSRGTVFVTSDGSSMTFISDAPVTEGAHVILGYYLHPTGHLFTADGTCYRVEEGLVRWIRDRNGNAVKFFYGTDSADIYSYNRVVKIVDSLDRVVNISYANLTTVFYDSIVYTGANNTQQTIKVWRAPLHGALRPGIAIESLGQLFPGSSGEALNDPYDPAGVIKAVELPDRRTYQLRYNQYGELARVELPTGGASEYDYTPWSGVYDLSTIHREVIERRVYESAAPGTPPLNKEVYRRFTSGNGTTETPYLTDIVVGQYDLTGPSPVLVTAEKHFFYGDAVAESVPRVPGRMNFFYPDWREGREYQVETYDPNGVNDLDALASMKLLRRVEQFWEPRAYANWADTALARAGVDARVVATVTRLTDTSPSLVSKVAYGYDRYNNVTDVYEYGWGQGAPGGLVRHGHTKYVTTNQIGGTSYDYACDPDAACNASATAANVIHIRNLPEERWVNEEAGDGHKRALTTFEYDNYTPEATAPAAPFARRHRELEPRGDISGLCMTYGTALPVDPNWDCQKVSDVAYKQRGNLTASASYLLSNTGSVLGSVVSNQQFDVAGNVIRSVDGRGYATDFGYEDNFGTANESAVDHAAPAGLQGKKSYAFATSATNALGHTVRTQFDYHTGAGVNYEDANGTVTSLIYGQGDPLGRLTQVVRAANYPDRLDLRSQQTYAYDDANRKVTTTGDLKTYGDNLLKAESFYDGLGRATESRKYEDATHYVASLTKYDGLGRPYMLSNPYRPPAESPVWTITEYDAVGRVRAVTSPDGAKVHTLYDGARTMVTDQAGNQRITAADALGRLTDVWEVTAADAVTEPLSFPVPAGFPYPAPTAGYHTGYFYDAQNKMRRAEQGEQRRHFAYDSLGRLVRVSIPEQVTNSNLALPSEMLNWPSDISGANNAWTLSFEYDENGALRKRTDARGVETNYAYDPLGRITQKDYGDVPLPGGGTIATPAVRYFYDSEALPAGAPAFARGKSTGRLVAVTYGAGSAEGSYAGGYDELGRAHYSSQVTVSPGADGHPPSAQVYAVGYDYNLDGGLRSETYPSGRVVESDYDSAGRLAGVRKQGGDYYAGGDPAVVVDSHAISYASHGAVAAMRLGNGLWEHMLFNQRHQPSEIGLGTSRADSSLLKLEYGYAPTVGGTQYPTRNNGNVRSQRISVPAEGATPAQTFTQSYGFDALDRLESASELNGTAETWKQVYSYDRYSNRRLDATYTTKRNSEGATVRAIDLGNRPSMNPDVSLLTNRIAEAGYAYDVAGNLLCDTQHQCGPAPSNAPYFGYDAEGKMVRAGGGALAGGSDYVYDGNGRRVKKVVGSRVEVFVYDAGGRLVAEYSNLIARGGTSYLTQDMLGSTRAITGENGGIRSRHDYQPFGGEINASAAPNTGRESLPSYNDGAVKQKFTGYERDGETELDFAQARYYNPMHGRFTAVDPLMASADMVNPQTWNRYVYVSNNPVVMIDPTGERGDYYNRSGEWLYSDNKDDDKVYLVISGGWGGGTATIELDITHTQFQIISNIVRQEGATDDTNEYLWIAHASNNEASATGRSLYNVLMSGFSSVSDKTALATTNSSLRANAARAGVIHILSGGTDPTGGARRWDGTDFVAWGLNSPNGTPHNKFEEYGTIAIPESVFNSFVSSQGANSIRYGKTRYTIPADVFNKDTHPENWQKWRIDGGEVSGFLYVTDKQKGILYATGTAGKSIFWAINYYWEKDKK